MSSAGFPSIIECRNSGAERLMEQLVRINWTGVIGRSSCLALVLVKRQHTARCLSEYLSNQGELISRGVRTTFINAGRSADKGEGLFSYIKRRVCASRSTLAPISRAKIQRETLETSAIACLITSIPLNLELYRKKFKRF